jgi:outer membrane receptor protein involved in Fe transport
MTAHVQGQVVHTGDSRTDIIEINSMDLDGYTTLGVTTGVRSDQWNVELYVNNLTNEVAELSGSFVFDRARVNVTRPRTIGVRVGMRY